MRLSLPLQRCIRSGFTVLLLTLAGCATGVGPTGRGTQNTVSPRPGLLSWPVPKTANLSRGFKSGFDKHDGLDLTAALGTSIFSAHDGMVVYAGNEFNGYGNLVIVENGKGWATFYSHCQKLFVKQGQKIRRGDEIASMGATGNASGVHLHFELRRNGTPVDPLAYLP